MRLHDWWPDPDTFNPDRFTSAAQHEAVSRYVFAPFGGGAHKCIGQQFADMTVKTVMRQLLRRFEWSTIRQGGHWGTGQVHPWMGRGCGLGITTATEFPC